MGSETTGIRGPLLVAAGLAMGPLVGLGLARFAHSLLLPPTPAVAYFGFGAGYIAYVTFVVAHLRDAGLSGGEVTRFWTVLGLSSIVGVPWWGRLMDRLASGRSLAMMNLVLVVGAVVPLLDDGLMAGIVSALIFGSSFLAVPAGMAHLARRHLPSASWATAIGSFTVVFGVGQTVGPAFAGAMADRGLGPGAGLATAAGLLAFTSVVYLLGEWRSAERTGRQAV